MRIGQVNQENYLMLDDTHVDAHMSGGSSMFYRKTNAKRTTGALISALFLAFILAS